MFERRERPKQNYKPVGWREQQDNGNMVYCSIELTHNFASLSQVTELILLVFIFHSNQGTRKISQALQVDMFATLFLSVKI